MSDSEGFENWLTDEELEIKGKFINDRQIIERTYRLKKRQVTKEYAESESIIKSKARSWKDIKSCSENKSSIKILDIADKQLLTQLEINKQALRDNLEKAELRYNEKLGKHRIDRQNIAKEIHLEAIRRKTIKAEEHLKELRVKVEIVASSRENSEASSSESEPEQLDSESEPEIEIIMADPPVRQQWSLRDLPKYEGRTDKSPSQHLLELDDYFASTNTDPNAYVDIITKFRASLRGKARVWYDMNIRVADPANADEWTRIKTAFKSYFNPLGCTREHQIKAWKTLSWDPATESLEDFVCRFYQLATDLGHNDQNEQLEHFLVCVPPSMYLYVTGAETVQNAVERLRRGMALGQLVPTQALPTPTTGNPLPFMAMNEKQVKFASPKPIRKQSYSPDPVSGIIVEKLTKLAAVVDNITEKWEQDKERDRVRTRDRERDRERDRDRNKNRNRFDSRNRSASNDRSKSRDRSSDRRPDRRDSRRNDTGRSGCEFCSKPGHSIAKCWALERLLRDNNVELTTVKPSEDKPDMLKALQNLLEKTSLNK